MAMVKITSEETNRPLITNHNSITPREASRVRSSISSRNQSYQHFPETTALGLWIADRFFHGRNMRRLLPRRAQQFVDPLPLDGDATALYADNTEPPNTDESPQTLASRNERHLRMRTGSDDHHIYVLDIKVDTFCLFSIDSRWRAHDVRYRQALLTRFAHWPEQSLPASHVICMLYITALTPEDVQSAWFPAMARVLMNTQVSVNFACEVARKPEPTYSNRTSTDRRRSSFDPGYSGVILEAKPFKTDAVVNGLTATLIVMKCHLDFRAMAKIFSYAPSQIAQEIRLYNLAPVLGVQATSHLLGCIFDEWKKCGFRTSQPELLLAATHLLVAHIGRKDYHEVLERAIPGTQDLVESRLRELLSVDYAGDPMADFTNYAKMAALRDGVIWGGMRSYAKDLDAHNQASVAGLQAFATAATSLFSSAAESAPIGGGGNASAGVQVVGSWAVWEINRWAGAHWRAGELDAALMARFDIDVTAPAKAGHLPGLKQDEWRWRNRQQGEGKSWSMERLEIQQKETERVVGAQYLQVPQQQSSQQQNQPLHQSRSRASPNMSPPISSQQRPLSQSQPQSPPSSPPKPSMSPTMDRWNRWRTQEQHMQEQQIWKDVKNDTAGGLSPANVQIIQDVYLTNVNYVMTFAMNGSVTPRLSTLRRVDPRRYF